MQRDLELAMDILEEYEDHNPFSEDRLRGRLAKRWEPDRLYYHLSMLVRGGYLEKNLLDRTGVKKMSEESLSLAEDTGDALMLTWKGHDLLKRLQSEEAKEIEEIEEASETFEKPLDE